MRLISTEIRDVLIIEPQVFRDDRGYFLETYHGRRFESTGLLDVFVQDNLSYSIKDALSRIKDADNLHEKARLLEHVDWNQDKLDRLLDECEEVT